MYFLEEASYRGLQLLLFCDSELNKLLLKNLSVEGLIEVNMTEIPMEEIELKFSKFFDIEFGGHWKPKDCKPRWKVGLVV